MKFKVGDRVEINKYGKGTIKEIYCQNSILVQFDIKNQDLHSGDKYESNTCLWCNNTQLKLIKDRKFIKSDLKDGDIVTYRDGEKAVVLRGQTQLRSINETGLMYLEDYDEELKYKNDKRLDIIKTERPIQYETVFEIKEEILDEAEKSYLRGVIRPFRDKIKHICKYSTSSTEEKIYMEIDENSDLDLPKFERKTMYKNMEVGKKYTIKELGL